MSPAKQKANKKQAAKIQRASPRQAPVSSGTAASAYNPVSGTFHTLEPVSSDPGTVNQNGRFRSIDDVDDSPGSNGLGAEFECMSNNGSCSGESEDQSHINGKEKHGVGTLRSPPGLVGGLDKRDKIREKNERKHQRQKERRAQELRDKCTGYLMSRKLEALSQQLALMGFSKERATMALILNDGYVEQSVAWLLEGSEGQVHEDWNTGGNPKIDISEELERIAEIEKEYKFARPDIERAIVSCEGELDKALECLQARSQNTSPARAEGHKPPGGTDDVPANLKESATPVATMPCSPGAGQTRANGLFHAALQSRREDKDPSHTKGRLQCHSVNYNIPPVGSARGPTHVRTHSNPLTNLQRSLSPAEQKGYGHGSRTPPCSQTASPPYVSSYIYAADTRTDSILCGSGKTDSKMVRIPSRDSFVNASSKETVSTGQSHQPLCTGSQPGGTLSSCPVSPSPVRPPSSWSCGFTDVGSPSSVQHVISMSGDAGLTTVKKLAENINIREAHAQHYHSLGSTKSDASASHWNLVGNGLSDLDAHVPSSNLVHSVSGSPLLSSYGLNTGWGTGLSYSSVDWSMGTTVNCDYKKIDWSMSSLSSPTLSTGYLQGLPSNLGSLTLQEKYDSGWNLEEERRFHAISETPSLWSELNKGAGVWKPNSSRIGVHDKTCSEPGNTAGFGAHEWTSPFAGKDLFTLPQAIPSPSL